MVPVARVKIKPTLERKVKNKGKKGIFLVRKWISNTFNSNSVQYQMHYRKKSLLFVQFWAARGFCQRVPNSRICQHCDVKTSTVTPTFYYFFIIFLTCYISVPSFIYNLCQVLLLRNHLKLRLIVMSTNLENRERGRQRKRESRATGQRSSTRKGARAREKKN